MPFAGYKDWDACISQNQDKSDPAAYCGTIKNKVEEVEQYDLSTPEGGDIPVESSLKTPSGEVTEEEKELKRGQQNPIAEEDYRDCPDGKTWNLDNSECQDEELISNEEGIGTVSGPPADSNMNYIGDKDDVFVSTSEVILLNENYIEDQFGYLYRPVYVGEKFTPDDKTLIFENKYYTTEGVGNCEFCQGAGKVTVENIGLKDCPDCDGTGDVQQQNPIMGQQPQLPTVGQGTPEQTQPPQPQAPDQLGNDPSKQTGQDQIPQQPMPQDQISPPQESPEEKKNPFGEAYIGKIDDKLDNLINQRLKLKLGEKEEAKEFVSYVCDDCGKSFNNPLKGDDHEKETGHDVTPSAEDPSHYISVESCGCKKKAHEANITKYKSFINSKIDILKSRAKTGEAVSLMYGLPFISIDGRKIKGTLAYAGVSLNDRIYLPEELKKGDGKTLPLLLNHSSLAGAEMELDRLSPEMIEHLENEKDFQVGEVTLTWDPTKLTLYYEGIVTNKFFQKEIDDMDMAVSLGIFYDSDSPRVCDENCYTLIKGAEFREVSLVYHAGFPIATIEAVEAMVKKASIKAGEDHLQSNSFKDPTEQGNTEEQVKSFYDPKIEAEEETDNLARGGSVDVEEKPTDAIATVSKDEWNEPMEENTIVAESLYTAKNFSIGGVTSMTVSNSNGVERYTLDPNMSYETNMVHFGVGEKGAKIYGEELQLQPKMTTTPDITKILEDKPDIEFTDSDAPAF